MKNKKIFTILFIILISLIILMPKTLCATYNSFRQQSEQWKNFFDLDLKSNINSTTYTIHKPDEFEKRTECKNGTGCLICNKNNYGQGYVLKNNKLEYGAYSDFRYFMTHYSNIWCVSHTTTDTTDDTYQYKLKDVIDINEKKVTFTSNSRTYTMTGDGIKEASRMAYLCWFSTKYIDSRPDDLAFYKSSDGKGNHWIYFEPQNSVWGGAWQTFFDNVLVKRGTYLKDFDTDATPESTNASLRNDFVYDGKKDFGKKQQNYITLIQNKITIKDNKGTSPTLESNKDGFTIDGVKYQTKIGPYNLNLNDDLTDKGIAITTKLIIGGTEYTGTLKKSSGYYYIYLKSAISAKPTTITITETYTKYIARLLLFSGEQYQTRAIVKGKTEKVTNSLSLGIPELKTDISLQKYVYSKDGNTTGLGSARYNMKAGATGANGNVNRDVTVKTTVKKDNRVKVEEGQWVTYKLTVYNNSNIPSDVTITDILPVGSSKYYWGTYSSSNSGTTVGSTREVSKKITNLAANDSTAIYITIKFNSTGDKTNKVEITGTGSNENAAKYRQVDYDYINIGAVSDSVDISLQKYIVGVNDSGINSDGYMPNGSTYKRKNKYYKDTAQGISSATNASVSTSGPVEGQTKYENPVGIQKGDKVIYRILVYLNKRDYTHDIKVDLRDVVTDVGSVTHYKVFAMTNANGNKTKTNIDSTQAAFETQKSKVQTAAAACAATQGTSGMTAISGNTIEIPTLTFSKGAADRADYYLDCFVVVYYGNEYLSGRQSNKISIRSIQLQTETPKFVENDTEYRIVDYDYIRMYKRDLSLQKYISKVNSTQITGRENRQSNSSCTKNIGLDSNKKLITSSGTYKYKDPVKINPTDEVTFTIRVYNNTPSKIKNIRVIDSVALGENGNHIMINSSIGLNKWSHWSDALAGYKRLQCTIDEIEGYSHRDITVTLKGFTENTGNFNEAYLRSEERDSSYRRVDADYVQINPIKEVSVQKYVVGTSKNKTYSEDRKNLFANEEAATENKKIKAQTSVSQADKYYYKDENYISIAKEEAVYYKIELYNNLEEQAEGTITDTLPKGATSYKYVKSTSKDLNQIFPNDTSGFTNITQESTAINLNFSLAANSTEVWYVAVKFDNIVTDLQENNVEITKVAGGNIGTYRVIDSDYIKMEIPDVSIQKYITEVQGQNLGDQRANQYAMNSNIGSYPHINRAISKNQQVNHKFYKYNEPVNVILSNNSKLTVKYKVIVYNNSSTDVIAKVRDRVQHGSIKTIKEVTYDSLEEDANITLTEMKVNQNNQIDFAVDRNDSLNMNEWYWYIDDSIRGNTDHLNNWKFYTSNMTFKAESKREFEITVEFDGNISEDELRGNIAWIPTVMDKDDINLTYSNKTYGQYRTIDSDYIKGIKPKVSLQKYISAANNELIDSRRNKNAINGSENGYLENGYNHSSNINSQITVSDTESKYSNPKEVKEKEEVEYTIEVYNSKNVHTRVTLIDKIRIGANNESGKILSVTNNGTEVEIDNNLLNTYTPNNTANNNSEVYYDKNNGDLKNTWTRYIDSQIDDGAENELNWQWYTYSFDMEPNSTSVIKVNVEFNGVIESEDEIIPNVTYISTVSALDLSQRITVKNNSDFNYRTIDAEYVKIESYYDVSLQKIVNFVNNQDVSVFKDGVTSRWESIEYGTTLENEKFNNPVNVNNGDKVTYAIKIKNNGNSSICINEIYDTITCNGGIDENFEDAFSCEAVYKGTSTQCNIQWENKANGKLKITSNVLVEAKQELIIYVTGTVKTPNISLDTIKNTAEISKIINKYGVDVTEKDVTSDNKDSDYIQMKDIELKGIVWNDKALAKDQNTYNGQYDATEEQSLDGVKVYLYREGEENYIATTTTSDGGKYNFKLDYIKGPKHEGIDRWTGEYYSYYVVFEYNGVVYTSTTFAEVTSNNSIDSNAKEDGQKVAQSRVDFNKKFSTINNTSNIEYNSTNTEGYIPQSKYKYNSEIMDIQSSTNKIVLSNSRQLDEQLRHINLGLKAKDVFDLELTSDVAKVEVTVNGQTATYNYNNKVTVRQGDISHRYVEDYRQNIRTTDIENSYYQNTGLNIKVTYELVVTNAAITSGKATKIIDYYDSKYTSPTAYYIEDGIKYNLETEEKAGEENYKILEITTQGTDLQQGNAMTMFVELTLQNPSETLKGLLENENLPTYNMAEILEYESTNTAHNNEYMRGLIDKDSAPGSAGVEKARLVEEREDTKTTLSYYFAKNNLDKLKYEDDTYTAPVLYFVNPSDPSNVEDEWLRKLTGIVFVDIDKNGKYDATDKLINGANVELIEKVGEDALGEKNKNISYNSKQTITTNAEGTEITYKVITEEDGRFTITGFLPGEHILKYYYGNNEVTLQVKDMSGNITDSYNGYLYESTQNQYENIPNEELGWWYLGKVENSSIATDDTNMRQAVKEYTKTLNNQNTKILNSYYSYPYTSTEVQTLKEKTQMQANSSNMLFGVEKENSATFALYEITDMNFGIKKRPETTLRLQKQVKQIKIVDSTERQTLVEVTFEPDGTPKIIGDAIVPNKQGSGIDISIADKNLQGAKMYIEYEVKTIYDTENEGKKTFKVIDYIPNNLSFNSEKNAEWRIVSGNREGIIDEQELKNTNVIVETEFSSENSISLGGQTREITKTINLQRVLIAPDSTITEIITSAESLIYDYTNIVEVIEVSNEEARNADVLKVQKEPGSPVYDPIIGGEIDTSIITTSDLTSIHPPTGSEGLTTQHYVIISVSLAILSIGIVLIKKYILKK